MQTFCRFEALSVIEGVIFKKKIVSQEIFVNNGLRKICFKISRNLDQEYLTRIFANKFYWSGGSATVPPFFLHKGLIFAQGSCGSSPLKVAHF